MGPSLSDLLGRLPGRARKLIGSPVPDRTGGIGSPQVAYLAVGSASARLLLSGVTGGCGVVPKHHGLCSRNSASPSLSHEKAGFFSRRWKSWLARAVSLSASRRSGSAETLSLFRYPSTASRCARSAASAGF